MTASLPPIAERREALSDVEGILQSGETLLWTGAPMPGLRLGREAVCQVSFGLPFLVIGMILLLIFVDEVIPLIIADELRQDPTDSIFVFAILGAGFGGIGGYMVFEPFVTAYHEAHHVRYVLSTRAAYILRARPIQRVEVYPILAPNWPELQQGRKAETVLFYTREMKDRQGDVATTRIGFKNIANGAEVHDLIQDIRTGVLQ